MKVYWLHLPGLSTAAKSGSPKSVLGTGAVHDSGGCGGDHPSGAPNNGAAASIVLPGAQENSSPSASSSISMLSFR